MDKQKYIVFIGFFLLVAIGGYFLAMRFGIFSKRQVAYRQQEDHISELMQEQQTNLDGQEDSANQGFEQQVASNGNNQQSSIAISKEIKESKTEEKAVSKQQSITKEDVVEKIIDTSKDDDAEVFAGKIVSKIISWGFQKSSGRSIDTIIVHTSYDALGNDPFSVEGILSEYKQYGVSAHYLIARDGVIYQLVNDQNVAWHAGVSKVPDGRTNVNDFSIGIEVMNKKDEKFSSDQYVALNLLIASLEKKYSIKNVLGHEDISPGRKTDPWGIDWGKIKK